MIWEREINVREKNWLFASHLHLTGDQNDNLGMYHDWELNHQCFGVQNNWAPPAKKDSWFFMKNVNKFYTIYLMLCIWYTHVFLLFYFQIHIFSYWVIIFFIFICALWFKNTFGITLVLLCFLIFTFILIFRFRWTSCK